MPAVSSSECVAVWRQLARADAAGGGGVDRGKVRELANEYALLPLGSGFVRLPRVICLLRCEPTPADCVTVYGGGRIP